jgi:hypothetical protein
MRLGASLYVQGMAGMASHFCRRRDAMSRADEQNTGRTVRTPAKQRNEETDREERTEPDKLGSAKETTTVRGKDEPQSVRHSA